MLVSVISFAFKALVADTARDRHIFGARSVLESRIVVGRAPNDERVFIPKIIRLLIYL